MERNDAPRLGHKAASHLHVSALASFAFCIPPASYSLMLDHRVPITLRLARVGPG
jgi:hypothetical protein